MFPHGQNPWNPKSNPLSNYDLVDFSVLVGKLNEFGHFIFLILIQLWWCCCISESSAITVRFSQNRVSDLVKMKNSDSLPLGLRDSEDQARGKLQFRHKVHIIPTRKKGDGWIQDENQGKWFFSVILQVTIRDLPSENYFEISRWSENNLCCENWSMMCIVCKNWEIFK